MAVSWDPTQKGADVVLSNGNLTANVTAYEERVRATLGRDPAAGGVYQWEISVPGGSGPNNVRPGFGIVDASADMTLLSTDLGFNTHEWGFRTAPPGDGSGCQVFHDGWGGDDWSGTEIGGTAFVAGLVWSATAKTLSIYLDGVLKYTLSSSSPGSTGVPVGTNGVLMYPAFCSYSNATPGTMSEHGMANFAGPFVYPIGGASPWEAPTAGSFFAVF